VLYVNGRANYDACRFEFNLLTGNYDGADVAFHFNPRFDQREAVRSSCQAGNWTGEEKQGGFPLQAGQDFEIEIICFPEHYQVNHNRSLSCSLNSSSLSNHYFLLKVNCNGQAWFTFRHRMPYQMIQALQVKGDVAIRNVRVM
jgi:galectin-4